MELLSEKSVISVFIEVVLFVQSFCESILRSINRIFLLHNLAASFPYSKKKIRD